MHMYDQRTQVLLSKRQLAELKRRARREQKSVGAVIRDAVDRYTQVPSDAERIIAMDLPVDDWPVMKAQIIAGALGKSWESDDDVPR
jgi:hypothetical protein